MINFHNDNINWGDFDLRKPLYNPDYYSHQDPFAKLSPDEFFNLPISEIKNHFNHANHRTSSNHYHPQKHSFIVNTVHQLCRRNQLPMMSVVLFKTDRIGAATVPQSEIDVSAGAVKRLNRSELTALLAHEVAHSVIHVQHLSTPNEETAADIIGAHLSSETGMINLLKFFAQHVTSQSTDHLHYSDPERIAKLKQAFRHFQQKMNRIHQLHSQLHRHRLNNRRLRQKYQERAKLKKIQALKQSLKKARQQNRNVQRH